MSSPQYAILFSAPVSGTAGTGSAGTILIPDATSGLYVIATTANRGTRRSTGIALTTFSGGQAVEIQQSGRIDALTAGLGAGTASWVRCSTTGTLERATVSGSDDVVGYVETDGTFHAFFGLLTAAMVNGGGGGGGYTPPTGDGYPHITAGAQDAAAVALTWTGDATGTGTGSSFALTVVKANGASVPAAGALTTGNVLQVSGASALSYGAVNLAGGANYVTGALPLGNQAAPTGTGYPHVTAGAVDAAAVSLTWTGDATGTGTGSSFALTVVKVNGASVPAAGALTTGNAAYVSGVSALTYSALNLGGGSGWVTGVLPVGNQASQAMAGDVTGTTAVSVVAKVHGATIPAAGALTTGNGPYVSGVSALTYSALNLAGGTGWVTGTLPLGNMASPTGTGLPHVVAGAMQAAASLLVDADVSATAAIAGTKISPNFGAQNVVTTGTGSFGTTPAAAGTLMVPANVIVLSARNSINANDDVLIAVNGGDGLFIGNDTSFSAATQCSTVNVYAGVAVGIGIGAATYLYTTGGNIEAWEPIIGSSLGTSPYGVHGTVLVSMGGSDHAVTADEYRYDEQVFTDTADGLLAKYPTPADEAHSYAKEVAFTGTGTSLKVTRADGGGAFVTLSTNTKARIRFRPGGAYICHTAIAYP